MAFIEADFGLVAARRSFLLLWHLIRLARHLGHRSALVGQPKQALLSFASVLSRAL